MKFSTLHELDPCEGSVQLVEGQLCLPYNLLTPPVYYEPSVTSAVTLVE